MDVIDLIDRSPQGSITHTFDFSVKRQMESVSICHQVQWVENESVRLKYISPRSCEMQTVGRLKSHQPHRWWIVLMRSNGISPLRKTFKVVPLPTESTESDKSRKSDYFEGSIELLMIDAWIIEVSEMVVNLSSRRGTDHVINC